MKGFLTMIAFLVLTVGCIGLWHTQFAYDLMSKGQAWLLLFSAPVAGLLFGLTASGGKIGKGFKFQDDQGKTVYNTFWVVFLLFTVAMTVFNLIAKSEM